jgi:hypothetical protein
MTLHLLLELEPTTLLYLGCNFIVAAAGGLALGEHARHPDSFVVPTFALGLVNVVLGLANIYLVFEHLPDHLYVSFLALSQSLLGLMATILGGSRLFARS